MSYTTQQDILDFVEDNNVKFVRFAFCDIFGTQKNIAVLAGDLPKALEDGVCFDGSSIAGFMKVEESDLVLRPDLSTVTILPWRPTEGRVMQFFCDVERPRCLWRQLPGVPAPDEPPLPQAGADLQRGGRVRVLSVRER
jgi:glutamine synthetase